MQNRHILFGAILAALAFLQGAQAVSPPPDVCYPNFTTAEGCDALFSLTTGVANTGVGWFSLLSNTNGSFNTGVGAGALALNTASNNTAVGEGAMLLNTIGEQNTALGNNALFHNDSGSENNAIGSNALSNNTTWSFNNAIGRNALSSNVEGSENIALGDLALEDVTTGTSNTAIGDDAGRSLVDGSGNVFVGDEAGTNVVNGSGNVCIGAGAVGPGDETRIIRIGDTSFTDYDCFIAGMFDRDVDASTALFVFVDDQGKVGTNLVDAAGNKVATPQAMLNESRNQQKRIAELEGAVDRLTAMLKEQAAQIQKVRAQLQMTKTTTELVMNEP